MASPPNLVRDRSSNPGYGLEQMRVQLNNIVASLRLLTRKLDADAGVASTNYRATITDAGIASAPRQIVVGGAVDPAFGLPNIAALAPAQPGAWYDSTSGLSAGAWVDRMGNGYDLPSAGAAALSIVPHVLNGRSAARFAGNALFYREGISPLGADPAAFTVLAIAANRSILGRNHMIFEMDALAAPNAYLMANFHPFEENPRSAYMEAYTGDGDVFTNGATAPSDAPVLLELRSSDKASGATFWLNGVQTTGDGITLPLDALPLTTVAIGGGSPGFAEMTDGDVFLVAALPVDLSTTDRQVFYNWVTAVYGIALPAAA